MCSVEAAPFHLITQAFKQGGRIDISYTLYGENKVPDIAWSGIPAGTKSFALIVDDPDAPTKLPWVHWLVFNIPVTLKKLPELGRKKELSDGTKQGITSFKKIGYDGPRPPEGKDHRYYFKLYALDTLLDLPGGATKEQLLSAMKGHILAQSEHMGLYKK